MTRNVFQFSEDTSISFESVGDGTRPLVLLHGFGASMESWNDILPELSKQFRVFRLDLKGHGLSSKPRDAKYSLDDQARIVAAFIRRNQLNDVVLVGHSYGGGVALLSYLALAESEAHNPVTAMVLVDSAGYPPTLPFFVSLLRNPILSTVVQTLVPARRRAEYTLRRLFHDPRRIDEERIERYAKYFDLPGAHYALTEVARQIVPKDIEGLLRQIRTITVPTLIIWGANDRAISPSVGHQLNDNIRGSRLEIMEDCGHIPHEERPRETVRIIFDFLEQK